ncbi:DUF6055 domain-containing protein [Actinoalloteichus hymeniacidonis]|uniref:Peptidase MA superfamily n=1 Tax=Actinoalloteichus hymeniacidonis TaxID=340345 RepID=A0AAC9HQH5_9PSEU|nr:DUF6055 domain-containing protein [Actinoalloteichus hymeniacidonis]AOS63550.1 hypothetical protein TL08_13680 [Actinoalloteichus hymeniacidonis]MBB5908404.1 hypothetical protein [Actinoalloteichus hymeniacidonis]
MRISKPRLLALTLAAALTIATPAAAEPAAPADADRAGATEAPAGSPTDPLGTVAPTTPDNATTAGSPAAEQSTQGKQARIPQFLYDAGAETGNSREPANFVVRWGDSVDVVRWAQENRGIADYPAYVLDVMERTYDYYVNQVGFADPDALSPGRDFKINIYLCGSWSGGFLPPANWAGADEVGAGHMCLPYDKFWDDWVESHEFVHVLQVYASQQNRAAGNGGGFGEGNPYAGPFWEAHANYLARMRRPEVVTGSGYLGRHHYRWLDEQTYYGDWTLINTLRDRYGTSFVDDLWFEARQGEHPITTIKRVLGLDHGSFAELIADHARRNVAFDYTDGAAIRSDLWRAPGATYRPLYTVSLQTVDANAGAYRIPADRAPQQYGYNHIELRPDSSGAISVRLDGTGGGAPSPDWRFGFVAVGADFSARYSPLYRSGESGSFALEAGETHLILVVTATPTEHVDYPLGTPSPGYPYALTVQGGTPVAGTT